MHDIVNSVLLPQNTDIGKTTTNGKGKKKEEEQVKKGEVDNDNDSNSTMCNAFSLAIGHFVYWVPYGGELLGFQEQVGAAVISGSGKGREGEIPVKNTNDEF